jgi:hypothetical protein
MSGKKMNLGYDVQAVGWLGPDGKVIDYVRDRFNSRVVVLNLATDEQWVSENTLAYQDFAAYSIGDLERLGFTIDECRAMLLLVLQSDYTRSVHSEEDLCEAMRSYSLWAPTPHKGEFFSRMDDVLEELSLDDDFGATPAFGPR